MRGMLIASPRATLAALVPQPRGLRAPWGTLALMRDMIDRAKLDPQIINAAHSIVALTPERSPLHEIRALFDWVRERVRFTADVAGVETLAYPGFTLRRKSGDCDDQTALLCSLLESIGYPTRLVIAGYQPDDPSRWEHVYCQVFTGAEWIDCEPIERAGFLGYSYPDPVQLFIEQR